MRKLLLGLCLIFAVGAPAFAKGVHILNGAGFSAPNVDGSSHVSNPQVGDIVFDTTSIGFYGYGGSSPGWMALGTAGLYSPTVQTFKYGAGPGTGNYFPSYYFNTSGGTAAVGDIYTNNGATFKVTKVIGGTRLVATSSGTPDLAGTLTFSSGSGGSTNVTFTSRLNNPLYIVVRMVGGGGGGGGQSLGNGGDGGSTTFGTSGMTFLSATYGHGGLANTVSGAGGTASISADAFGTAISGGRGSASGQTSTTAAALPGGSGASSPFGGAGGGADPGTAGFAAALDSGSGGGGAGGALLTGTVNGGGGGGAGGYISATISPVLSSYAYAVGHAGAGGNSGSTPQGGDGGSGYIEVTEYYQ